MPKIFYARFGIDNRGMERQDRFPQQQAK